MADDVMDGGEFWSDLRQAALPRFEARLYWERAGLSPTEAVEWWEHYILSAEAASAIAEGRSITQELERLSKQRGARSAERRQARGSVEPKDRRSVERARERARKEQERAEQAARDQAAELIDFCEGLSPETAALVRRIKSVRISNRSDLPRGVQVERAVDGRMMCVRYVTEDGFFLGARQRFDWSFGEVLENAATQDHRRLQIDGLDDDEAIELLTAPEFLPTTIQLVSNWDVSGLADMTGLDDRDGVDAFEVNGVLLLLRGGTLVAWRAGDDARPLEDVGAAEPVPAPVDVARGVVVWGYLDYHPQLGMLEDFEHLAEQAGVTRRLLDDPSWRNLIELRGEAEVRDRFESYRGSAWQDHLDHAAECSEMPEDWYREELPDLSGDWLACRPRITEIACLHLPKELQVLGVYRWHVDGERFSWEANSLPELKRRAHALGYRFVKRQDLVNRSWVDRPSTATARSTAAGRGRSRPGRRASPGECR